MTWKLLINHLSFIIRKSAGFTLIELMVVLSITSVLGTLGIAGFVSYNQNQVLQSSTSEVVTMLNLAKSRAASQIKPSKSSDCIGYLSGYKVVISLPRTYTLYVCCSISSDKKIDEQDKQLPEKLSFSSGSDLFIFFPVHMGGAQVSGVDDQFVISSSDGKTKTIKINSLGGVSVK